jgi:hypothetical protein
MKPRECEKELLVIDAARTGSWDAELRQHISDCHACADVALAAQAMNEMRAIDEAEARVPDAGLMWWKAQLLSKRAAGERATQPIRFVEHFSYACGIAVFIGVCVWQWAAIRGWLVSLWPGSTSTVHTAASAANRFDGQALQTLQTTIVNWIQNAGNLPKSSIAIILSVGVLSIFVAFAAYLTRSEQ